jgi:hypothetical protein
VGDVFNKAKDVISNPITQTIASVAKPALDFVPGGSLVNAGLGAIGLGAPRRRGRPPTRIKRARRGGAGPKTAKRNAIVKEVMAKHGVPMITASKMVKAHGLY